MDENVKYGFYSSKKGKLIKDFREIAETVRPFMKVGKTSATEQVKASLTKT